MNGKVINLEVRKLPLINRFCVVAVSLRFGVMNSMQYLLRATPLKRLRVDVLVSHDGSADVPVLKRPVLGVEIPNPAFGPVLLPTDHDWMHDGEGLHHSRNGSCKKTMLLWDAVVWHSNSSTTGPFGMFLNVRRLTRM